MARTSVKQFSRPLARSLQWFSLLTLLYLAVILVLPGNHTTELNYNLSSLGYKIVYIDVALPSVLVWLAAFFGYAKLYEYSNSIKSSPEGPYFNRLARGCAWLAWSLPISSISSYVLAAIDDHWSSFHSASIILDNYILLMLSVVALAIIGSSASGITNSIKLKLDLISARVITIVFLVSGVVYCFLIFRHFDLTSLTSTNNPYYLPIWLMVLTVIIPYLYAWFVGMLAAYQLSLYSRDVHGLLYRKALSYLVFGIVAVIISLIFLQYLSVAEPSDRHLVFNYRLLLVLAFRILDAIGFIVLAFGASQLKKIEDI